ncbi:calcium-binding protein [Aestuariicoccus sp. MJ-SS9]|uniref:calcium-binding protein n=1 Tax=Aestuariicoccus sp. MJ-SS9 TaxID=3079855 RepID=UPI00290AE01E|nr:calcium-binding protein [Aestuariicoccus sp. MJ-SS9]MDU8910456.1 calcium-binding protein [Aestuariicoccus sp. MJ-SS9]
MTDIPGDFTTEAVLLPDVPFESFFEPGGDADMFRVELEAGQAYRLYFLDFNGTGEPRAVYDEAGDLLAYLGEFGAPPFSVPESGSYFVSAYTFLIDDGEPYTIILDTVDFDDPGSAPETAFSAEVDNAIDGSFDFIYDTDWYSVNLMGGQGYKFRAFSGSLEFSVKLVDAAGTSLAEITIFSDISEEESPPILIAEDGTYFLVVGPAVPDYYFDPGLALFNYSVEIYDAASETLTGTEYDDTLIGGPGSDIIIGLGGSDRIKGLAGPDRIEGGSDSDAIQGGEGSDIIAGGPGDDHIAAQSGADSVTGDEGHDRIGGGTGNDLLYGGAGNDSIGGGDGRDVVYGEDGDDVVNGGPGNDYIFGGDGSDTLGGSVGNDFVNGGMGDDNLGGGPGKDDISSGMGDDSLGGGEGDDSVYGYLGNDFLAGGGRDDVISGGDGLDTINGGDGDDTMTGGDGADVFVWNFFKDGDADVITDFEDGIDSFLIRIVNPETGAVNISNGGNGLQGYVDALNITDTAEGALIDYQGHTVLIEGVAAADLTVEDFTFL